MMLYHTVMLYYTIREAVVMSLLLPAMVVTLISDKVQHVGKLYK